MNNSSSNPNPTPDQPCFHLPVLFHICESHKASVSDAESAEFLCRPRGNNEASETNQGEDRELGIEDNS